MQLVLLLDSSAGCGRGPCYDTDLLSMLLVLCLISHQTVLLLPCWWVKSRAVKAAALCCEGCCV